jgi:hypothetical protein
LVFETLPVIEPRALRTRFPRCHFEGRRNRGRAGVRETDDRRGRLAARRPLQSCP